MTRLRRPVDKMIRLLLPALLLVVPAAAGQTRPPASETARALQQIRTEAADFSVAIASKILQRSVSREDNERLISSALDAFGRVDVVFANPIPTALVRGSRDAAAIRAALEKVAASGGHNQLAAHRRDLGGVHP